MGVILLREIKFCILTKEDFGRPDFLWIQDLRLTRDRGFSDIRSVANFWDIYFHIVENLWDIRRQKANYLRKIDLRKKTIFLVINFDDKILIFRQFKTLTIHARKFPLTTTSKWFSAQATHRTASMPVPPSVAEKNN